MEAFQTISAHDRTELCEQPVSGGRMTGEQTGFPPVQGQEAPQLRVSPELMTADTALGPPLSVSLVGLTDTRSRGG